MTEPPIACTLGPEALKARKEGVLADLLGRAREREEIPNGHRLRFVASNGLLPAIAQAIELERQCCRFLRFTVSVEPDGGPITVELTGPHGTGEFLSALWTRD